MEGTISEVRLFGPNWAPCNWFLCEGQLLEISQFKPLYSLIGNSYGGDGVTTFALPDMRGRVPFGQGQGTGLTNRQVGDQVGTETVTLSVAELPAHSHSATTSTPTVASSSIQINAAAAAITPNPAGSLPAQPSNNVPNYGNTVGPAMSPNMAQLTSLTFNPVTTTVGDTGGDGAHNNMQPGTCLSFIICYAGLFPTRG